MSDTDQKDTKKIRHRKKHKNSRLGCPQCKQRRIKCDETLPSCKKCSARAIRCGYLDFTPQEINIVRQAHMDDDEMYQHAMGPMTQLIKEQNNYLQIQVNNQQPQHMPSQSGEVRHDHHQPHLQQHQHHLFPQDLPPAHQASYHPYQQLPQHQNYLPDQIAEFQQQPNQFDQAQYYGQLNQYNEYQSLDKQVLSGSEHSAGQIDGSSIPLGLSDSMSSGAGAGIGPGSTNLHQGLIDRGSYSTSVSELSHPIQIESILAPSTQLPVMADSTATPFGTSSISSYSSKNSPFTGESERYRNFELLAKSMTSPSSSVKSGSPTEVPLVRHQLNEPQFDLNKFPEFFHETIPNAFARVFLLKEVHSRLVAATKNEELFYGMLLQGVGKLSVTIKELEGLFLKFRGYCMNTVRNQLSKISDSNSEQLLMLTSILNSSSIYVKKITMKDFFSLASGPSVLLKTAFEDPSKFQKSYIKLKNHADGLLFTARSVWNPRYNHRALFEILEVVKEFGAKYIDDEDRYNDDDLIKSQYVDLVKFLEFALNMLEGEKSDKHVLLYPVDKIYKLVQLWYINVPSEIYTFGSKTPPVEKAFYTFWFALGEMLEDILVGGRYIFTFLFNGFYLLYPFNKDHLYENFEDEEMKKYVNYSCRIIAFLNRRKAYIVRNTVLNDPIPAFFDSEDRFKPRALDIHECCITSFKNTKIKPYHYPSESTTSGNLASGSNYYKTHEMDDQNLADKLFENLDTSFAKDSDAEDKSDLDMLNVDPDTGLLHDDYDPRFNDPIFQTNVVFQDADLNFLHKYHEDRKMIIQLDMKD